MGRTGAAASVFAESVPALLRHISRAPPHVRHRYRQWRGAALLVDPMHGLPDFNRRNPVDPTHPLPDPDWGDVPPTVQMVPRAVSPDPFSNVVEAVRADCVAPRLPTDIRLGGRALLHVLAVGLGAGSPPPHAPVPAYDAVAELEWRVGWGGRVCVRRVRVPTGVWVDGGGRCLDPHTGRWRWSLFPAPV